MLKFPYIEMNCSTFDHNGKKHEKTLENVRDFVKIRQKKEITFQTYIKRREI